MAVHNQLAELLSTVITAVFAFGVIIVRMRGSGKPTSAFKILIPPLGMSTGFLMFLAPETHDPWLFAGAAFVVGLLFSGPLIATSRMYISGDDVCMKRSRWFIVILLVLLALRIALHQYVEHYVTIMQTGSLFFILAFGMILPWRLAMYARFRRLEKQLPGVLRVGEPVSEG